MRTFKTLEDFYRSREWERFRKQLILERLNKRGETIDEHTGNIIVNKNDIVLHHIKALTLENVNYYNISFNPENIKIVSQSSHNNIHNRFGFRGNKQVYIVYGAPCSGKSPYVKNAAGPNDLVIDIDSIWICISNNLRYIKPAALKKNVFNVRDNLLDQVRTRLGNWENAWIIGTYPLVAERQRLRNALNCQFIFINKSEYECLNNLYKYQDRNIKAWEVFIHEWFERYQQR